MINRTRMLLDDLDSEGFPVAKPREPAPLLALNLGRTADHQMVQALLADHKCLNCVAVPNQPLSQAEQAFVDAHEHLHEVALARRLVREADLRMDAITPWSAGRLANAQVDGIKQLSDRAAPDAYFGWK